MTVYYLVWLSTIIFGLLISRSDYQYENKLTEGIISHSESAKILYIISSMLLILFAGCRYYVGADFGAYYNFTNYLDFWGTLKKLDEPGIRLIYIVASRIHPTGQFCIFSVAAVTLGLELRTIYKNTDQIGFALILFCFMCWAECFNGVRQALAVSILFCGFPALRERNFKKYAFFSFLSFLCHRSAIVMIIVFFMTSRKVNRKNVILLAVLSVLILFSYERVYHMVNIVLNNEITGNELYWATRVNRLRPAVRVIPALFFLGLYRNEEKTDIVSFYLNVLIVSAVIGVVTMNSAALSRMSMYTSPFVVIAMVELIKKIAPSSRKLVSTLIVFLYGIFEWVECSGVSFTFNNLRWPF